MILKKNWPQILIGSLVILSLSLSLFYLVKKYNKGLKPVEIKVITPAADAYPLNVTLSDISPNSLTVSWVSVRPGSETSSQTPEATTGKLIYSQNQAITGETNGTSVFDLRGENYAGTTHIIKVTNLLPQTTYYFKIKSGNYLYSFKENTATWVKNGLTTETAAIQTTLVIANYNQLASPQNPYGAYSLETGAFLPCPNGTDNPSTTSCYRPNPLSINANNQSDVLVYLKIKRGNETVSSIISCLSNTDGLCPLDLANLYTKDLTHYLAYNPSTDKISLWAEAGDKGKLPETEKPIPEVFNDSCYDSPLQCNTPPIGERNFILQLVVPTQIPTTTPIPTQRQPTPTITPLPTPTITLTPTITIVPPNTPILNLQVRFSGINNQPSNPPNLDYRNQKVKLIIKRKGQEKPVYENNNVIVASVVNNNQLFYKTIDNSKITLLGVTPDRYDVYIKGPKHLQKKFSDQNLTSGTQIFSFLGDEEKLLGGDLPLPHNGDFNNLIQDGKVNSLDYSFIVNNMNQTETKVLKVADLNLDGIINSGDTSILAITLGEKIDEDAGN